MRTYFAALQQLKLNASTMGSPSTTCQPKSRSLDTKAQIMIAVLVLFGCVMLIGTALEILIYRPQPKEISVTLDGDEAPILVKNPFQPEDAHYVIQILLAFSIYTNTKKIFSTETTNAQISCLSGIRFLSMVWVILWHTYVFSILITCKKQYKPATRARGFPL